MADPAPQLRADLAGADAAPGLLQALVPEPIVCLPHVGASLPLRLLAGPAGPLMLRLQWQQAGVDLGGWSIDLPDAPSGERAFRVELEVSERQAGRHALTVVAETPTGATVAELTLAVDVCDFVSQAPAVAALPDTLRRRSLFALPSVPLDTAPPGDDARILLREALPMVRAEWDRGDLDAMAATGMGYKRLVRTDPGPPLSVFVLHDAALLGPNVVIATPRGVVDESWGASYPNPSPVSAIDALLRPRRGLPRAGTVALALPIPRFRPLIRSLRGFNHYHLHAEHLCALLQIEALVQGWRGVEIETLLPDYDALHLEAIALLAPELGTTRPAGEEEMLAERVLLPSGAFHSAGPDPLLAQVFARIRRNALAPPEPRPGGARVYVSRLGSPLRTMHNEEDLVAAMAARGFDVFDARGLGYRDQVLALAGARIIVGPHGAGLINAGFAAPGAVLVEAFSPYYYAGCFQSMAAIVGHRYRAWKQPTLQPATSPQAPWELDIPAFLAFLDRVLEAEERRGDSPALP